MLPYVKSRGEGGKVVASAGTPVQLLAAPTLCTHVTITARPANAGVIAVGFSGSVHAGAGAEVGATLRPGGGITLPVNDVSLVWIDASIDGEGVSFTYDDGEFSGGSIAPGGTSGGGGGGGSGDASALNQGTQIGLEQSIRDYIGAANAATVATEADGSVSSKLRGLIKLALAWTRGAGAVTAETQRITLASDDPAVQSLSTLAGLDKNAGNTSGTTLRVVTAADGPLNTAVGGINDAKVAADAVGSLSAKLRGLVAFAAAWTRGAGAVSAETQRITLASDDPAVATLGATTGAAVVTDANGSIQQYLRGLVKLWIAGLAAGEAHVGEVGGRIATVGGVAFNRPNDTTAYAVGDLIANDTVAANVVPVVVPVARANDVGAMLRRLRLKVNDAAWVNATVRVHAFKDSPTVTVGDNGAFATVSGAGFVYACNESTYIGSVDVTFDKQFNDPMVKGIGVPNVGTEINLTPHAGSQNIYLLFEARTAVTPAVSKTFTTTLEILN